MVANSEHGNLALQGVACEDGCGICCSPKMWNIIKSELAIALFLWLGAMAMFSAYHSKEDLRALLVLFNSFMMFFLATMQIVKLYIKLSHRQDQHKANPGDSKANDGNEK